MKKSKDEVKTRTNIKQVRNELADTIRGLQAADHYFGKEISHLEYTKQVYNAIFQGIQNPKVELDSAAFLGVFSNDT